MVQFIENFIQHKTTITKFNYFVNPRAAANALISFSTSIFQGFELPLDLANLILKFSSYLSWDIHAIANPLTDHSFNIVIHVDENTAVLDMCIQDSTKKYKKIKGF